MSSKLFTGLFIVNGNEILYNHEIQITFWCPMRFQNFPLDDQLCKFQLGSYAYDNTKMKFSSASLSYNGNLQNKILDYKIELKHLKPEDSHFVWLYMGNYSLTGFEIILKRNSLKYLVNYYLPSGLFVVVSWVSLQKIPTSFDIRMKRFFLGKLLDSPGDSPWPHDTAHHYLSCPHQYFQYYHLQLSSS